MTASPQAAAADDSHEPHQPHLIDCDACGATKPTPSIERHIITETYFDQGQCAQAEGAGYWVCSDCHHLLHSWMRRNPQMDNPAKEAFHRIFKILANIIEPRQYRRNSPDQGTVPGPDESDQHDTKG